MNAQRIARETALSQVRASRETRRTINPYDCVVYAGTQCDRYQILRRIPQLRDPRGSYLVHFGSYATLEEAIAARDALPREMPPRPRKRFDGNETFRGIRD